MGENKSIQILIHILGKRTQSRTHLFVTLNLGVDKGSQNVRCERQVDVDELGLLMQAIQGEVIPQLHGYDRVFLLKEQELSDQEEGAKHLQQEKTAFLPIPAIQTYQKPKTGSSWTHLLQEELPSPSRRLLLPTAPAVTCCQRASNKCGGKQTRSPCGTAGSSDFPKNRPPFQPKSSLQT